ncbi:hypothetical protein VPNG_05108 [Cytospora leucostoma]|uniref:UBC core domain-containing protein n=1 Tax=Cytospora leucostoma TaxID=1230097 RepID=A0A423X464_9PEZI|nr:hypothetical protein VPNG_05108 [Cytospora leucostoma]
MTLKRYNADVRAARSRLHETGIPGIEAIERGDSEGEVVVTLVHKDLPEPFPIRILAQNVDDYPDNNNFLLFIDSEDMTGHITAALEQVQDFTFGQKILEAITTISTGIQRSLSTVDPDGDTNMDGVQGPHLAEDELEDDDDSEEVFCFDDDDDEEFGLASLRPRKAMPALRIATSVLRRIKRDLRKAHEAGCKVGVLGGLDGSSRMHIISLSVRASKLGLSQETLEAWDVEVSDYIALLIRIEDVYPSSDKLAEQSASNFHIQFRFGKCTNYKPSLKQAQEAFATTFQTATPEDTSTDTKNDNYEFQKVFMSNSMEQFMNESFISLVKLRFRGYATWDEANAKLRSYQTPWDSEASDKEKGNSEPIAANYPEAKDAVVPGPSKNNATGEHLTSDRDHLKCSTGACPSGGTVTNERPTDEYHDGPEALPPILLLDSFAGFEPSVPLIAMQFAIHYFVRCTEYCLRCHRRIDKGFEALKPFVCSDPLCLFQYITMGLGPSIEHEIITQPYVVDLLVSLCYSSVQSQTPLYYKARARSQYPIRNFPSGLRLKVPNTRTDGTGTDETPVKVRVDLDRERATVPDATAIDRVPAGAWVVLRHQIQPSSAGHVGQAVHHQAYIKYVDRQTSSLTLKMIHRDATAPKVDSDSTMDLFVYSTEFDDLDAAGKATAMLYILDTLPPISHIREYLIRNPQSDLKSYDGISSAAATLLEWIVASNRSCIFQVSPVDDRYANDTELLKTVKIRDQEAIPSMSSCVQFRFAQGAPDKELRFHQALGDLNARKQTEFPTLFAWHGSSLANWHSILRQGLDFSETMNGRAFGHGVYFSQDFNVSTGYLSTPGVSWRNSALNTFGVISLCEIVNDPDKFVSTTPHLVVNQVDWIQCRYLFVRLAGIPSAPAPASSSTANKDRNILAIPQDPTRSVRGPDGKVLKIPMKAKPSGRVTHATKKHLTSPSSSKRTHEIAYFTGCSDEEDGVDLECIYSSDNEGSGPPWKRFGVDNARGSSIDTIMADQVAVQRPPTPPQTDFRPGTLDLSALPQLPVPDWANSNATKRLTSDIKHMQKVQSCTPLHELGWYIDFDKVDNMFQWIVELHSFGHSLPLSKDMKKAGITSIVIEVRFGREYPFSPPFVRVIRPRFLPFASGGGGHVTIGGAICLELLTSTGWSPVTSMEAVFLSVRMALSETEPAARLENTNASARKFDYSANEALDAYVRFAQAHGWKVPKDLRETAGQVAKGQVSN